MPDELSRLDAVALAELIRSGQLSPVELIDDTIDRIERLNPAVNAVISPQFEKARTAAGAELPDGPFRGVPMLMKDLWPGETGEPFHLGNRGLKSVGYRATEDANLVTAYRDAGFVICGRTNTPALGLAATTEPLAYGPTSNPWDLERGSGGSSGGAAAAVAAGMLPAANASDGGGSIRIPAAMCGLVGLKPSRGRISMGPLQDEWGNSVQHVVSHTVRDSAAILDATAYPFPGDGVIAPGPPEPYANLIERPPVPLRMGLLDEGIRGLTVDPEVQTAVRAAATLLERLGHHIETSSPDALHDDELLASMMPIAAAGIASTIDGLEEMMGRPVVEDDVEPWTRFIADRGRAVPGPAVVTAQKSAMVFRRRMAGWWAGGFDLMLAPTCLRAAPLLGEMAPDSDDLMAVQNTTVHYSSLTQPFNITGQPAISLPLAQTESGLPIGIQLVAAYGNEHVLLQLAAQLEAEVRWADTRAPIHP